MGVRDDVGGGNDGKGFEVKPNPFNKGFQIKYRVENEIPAFAGMREGMGMMKREAGMREGGSGNDERGLDGGFSVNFKHPILHIWRLFQ